MKLVFSSALVLLLSFCCMAQKYITLGWSKRFMAEDASVTSATPAGGAGSGTITKDNSIAFNGSMIQHLKKNFYFTAEGSYGLEKTKYQINGKAFETFTQPISLRLMLGKTFIKNLLLFHAGAEAAYAPGDKKMGSYALQDGSAKFFAGATGGLQISYGGIYILGRYHYRMLTGNYTYKLATGATDYIYTITPAKNYFTLGIGLTWNAARR
jgi:hypothetical protein